ncbi:MAG TPA: response regulator transcription factor [Xanthomonadaceae bacterium]|jgi:DNA-binding response OmpR family regulator|nr:response regulator transcription factor [Xanthomonadaceae bacterium]
MKLLIVEDNRNLVGNLFDYFEQRGHVLDAAPDGITGLHLALQNDYDAVVLDWTLPRLDGIGVLRGLRKSDVRHVPVLMLTAREGLPDKLSGFGAGADDYLTKPFALPELEVRLLALVARCGGHNQRVLVVADLKLDLDSLDVVRGGKRITVYPSGRKILELLMRSAPAIVKREQLERALWGDAPPDNDLLRSHLYDLRRAVDAPFSVKLIHTVVGVGYRIAEIAERGD